MGFCFVFNLHFCYEFVARLFVKKYFDYRNLCIASDLAVCFKPQLQVSLDTSDEFKYLV